jgi:hypothetical protein
MSKFMGIIRFRCSDDLEARFAAAAQRAGVKPAELGRAVLERAVSQLEARSTPSNDSSENSSDSLDARTYEGRSERLVTRLTPSEYAAVLKSAAGWGMTPYTWTARLIRAHLIKEPQLSQDERKALREATRELGYVGRNLNQVAHALNMSMSAKDKATVELMSDISAKVDVLGDTIKEVLDQNLNRWGV